MNEYSNAQNAELNFVLQQGFLNVSAEDCELRYAPLMIQPRIIGVMVLIGLILQAWPIFLALSAVLWWNVMFPRLNLFDALYNQLIAPRKNLPRILPAPPPRRFSQAVAASFNLIIAISLFFGWSIFAYVFEIFLVVALIALIFGRFCLGSYVYHLLKGDQKFANRTLPWVRNME